MRGYQSIPSADIDGIENGDLLPTTTMTTTTEEDHPHPPSRMISSPQSSWIPPFSRYASKVGLVSIGIIVGCIGSRALARRDRADVDDGGGGSLYFVGPVHNDRRSFAVNGKSFYDSLPFEDVVSWTVQSRHPRGWETSLTTPAGSAALDGAIASLSPIADGDNVDVVIAILGAANPPPATPHILYHATQTAFGLLYDASRSSSGYISEYALDYFLINSGGFDAQVNQAYCAVASVATLLNSLKYPKRFRDGDDLSGWSFDLPTDPRYNPYPYATQQDVLAGECVRDNVIIERGDGSGGADGSPRGGSGVDGIFRPPYGLSLEQAGKLLNCHTSSEWVVTVQNVDPSQVSLLKVRYDLKAALIDPDARVMINYDRRGLGQVGGGHFSPLGAYHVATDSFLVMDVAKYKYPPVWVGADTLYGAMATVDRCGTYDYPGGQERLIDGTSGGAGNALFDPTTQDDYENSLRALNCKERMRGYIILKKKGSVNS
ncbi:hypothetical protein ACHAXA_006971 [Cyclostephanos tholiformis]|uniref:glutathione gamma-glutamylcysteinyltransferase n=1 Tax=Cyclostephanos tholiformis TaxID=382380 RepID=A0ABD3RXH3_9STRA